MAAVAGASPVSITVRTPRVCNSAISVAESALGGSLRAMMPAIRGASGGPTATASTRKPCASSWSAVVDASGRGCATLMTAATAPFTMRIVVPLAFTAVAPDIFVAGSKGTKLVSFGRSEAAL